MKLSYNWLNDYVDLSDIAPAQLSDLLTMKTCEVEGVSELWPHLKNFPVALVKSVKKHPDADKLTICETDSGNGIIQIVTGAPNVEAGKKYPLAAVGVTLPSGMTMKPAKLRGQESMGMLCSASEIDLTLLKFEDAATDGLLTLPDSFAVGKSMQEELGSKDFILEIDNKSITHRPDLWCHFGFAREIAALLGKKLKFDPYEQGFATDNTLKNSFAVKIEDQAALRYTGAVLTGFSVRNSPLGLQVRLCAVGQKPVNNVVDVSNYVLLEMAQPNHAFDAQKLSTSISVSRSQKNEKIKTLDGAEHTLPEGTVVIRSDKTAVAVAGVMGGSGTEVTGSTTTLFLESACFHRSDIRATVAKTGIRSESSQRFEKGQYPAKAHKAIYRFASLLAQSEKKVRLSEIKEDGLKTHELVKIAVALQFLRDRSGIADLSLAKVTEILEKLGMKVALKGNDLLDIEVPEWRSFYDVTLPEDILEEIGRVIGYREIKHQPLLGETKPPASKNHMREYEHHLRTLFSQKFHFSEVYNYAFHAQKDIACDDRFSSHAMTLKNAIQADLPYMRVSPLPGLLKNIANNWREQKSLRFFEIERIFIPRNEQLPSEKTFLAAIMTSPDQPAEITLEFLSGMAAEIFLERGVSVHDLEISQGQEKIFHPGRSGITRYTQAGQSAQIQWGQVHPRMSGEYGIDAPVWYLEFMVDDILWLHRSHLRKYYPPAKYPGHEFELTLVCAERVPFHEIRRNVPVEKPDFSEDKTFISDLQYITTFRGEQIGAGNKAVSIKIHLENRTRTLQPKEIADTQAQVVKNLANAGFSLRS